MKIRTFQINSAYLYLAPAFCILTLIIILPIFGTLYNSFFRDISFINREFHGITNYVQLLKEPGFWQAVRFTIAFIIVSIPIELGLGILIAQLLNVQSVFQMVLRSVILIPWAIPQAISARVWELIYNYSFGFANIFLLKIGLISEPINWLGSSHGAFWSIVLTDVWKTVPFVTIIILMGLQTIGTEIKEQAQIDGANIWQIFWYIILPILKPVILVALIFRTIDALRVFDVVFVLTGGGPGGTTNSLSLYAYQYFLNGDFGFGSTISVVLFIIAFVLSLIYVSILHHHAK
ncbi:carbohydrate ABC transporter permease [Candidatus Margulisiibacteriota bacterium]